MTIMRELDILGTAMRLTTFIKETVASAGFSRVAVAVSGGIDSATAISLAAAALGSENVFALSLPYKDWHTDSELRTRNLLHQLHIPAAHIREMDISPMVDAFQRSLNLWHPVENLSLGDQMVNLRLGNIMARVRMIALFDYARELSALVLGTENKSEHYLGYFTRFGDEASDLEPLRTLYKTEVFRLAEHLGVPREIREAVPTAGLWPGQSDEGQFGFTYRTADQILYGLYDLGLSEQELAERGLDRERIEQVRVWVSGMSFKHDLPRLAPEPVFLQK